MKKFMILSLALVMALLSSISVFAGDVPEQLAYEDTAQVFWGTVKTIFSDGDEVKVEVSCDKILKGEVNETEVYTNPYNIGGFEITVGNTYLMTSLDRKEPYFIETTSQDTKILKLKNIDGMDMWERMEKSLNDGLFEQAEQKRIEKIEEPETSSTSVIGGADAPTDIKVESTLDINIWVLVGIGAALVILIAGVILVIKKKSK